MRRLHYRAFSGNYFVGDKNIVSVFPVSSRPRSGEVSAPGRDFLFVLSAK